MRKSNTKLFVACACVMVAISAFGGIAIADHNDGANSEDVVYVNSSLSENDVTNDTYVSIQDAVDNASEGYHVNLTNSEYEEDVNLTVNDTHFRADGVENVTVTGELNGTSDENVTNVHVGDNVEFTDGVVLKQSDSDGSGAFLGDVSSWEDVKDVLSSSFMGIPYLVWALLIGIVGYIVYKEFGE